MSTPLTPMGEYVVAENEAAEEKTASGLYLPEQAKEKSSIARVLAVGKDVKGLKVGDRIVYKSYSTTDVKVESKDYIIIKEEDILATVK